MPTIVNIDDPYDPDIAPISGAPPRFNSVTIGPPPFIAAGGVPPAAPKAADATDKESTAVYGEEISTFDAYVPHSLPPEVVRLLVSQANPSASASVSSSSSSSSSSAAATAALPSAHLQPPPPPSSAPPPWVCQHCTLENGGSEKRCGACDQKRPAPSPAAPVHVPPSAAGTVSPGDVLLGVVGHFDLPAGASEEDYFKVVQHVSDPSNRPVTLRVRSGELSAVRTLTFGPGKLGVALQLLKGKVVFDNVSRDSGAVATLTETFPTAADSSSSDAALAAVPRSSLKDGLDFDLVQSTWTVPVDSGLKLPPPHSFLASQSTLMCSTPSPLIPYDAYKPLSTLDPSLSKFLTPLQLEGVGLALSRFQRLHGLPTSPPLPPPARSGFFLGDGAGVGKGRQISAILLDSYLRGRPRSLWLSVSRDLKADARRDVNDCGGENLPVHDAADLLESPSAAAASGMKGLGVTKGDDRDKGVAFATYSLLIAAGGRRLAQMLEWLDTGQRFSSAASGSSALAFPRPSFSGVIVFDECHKAKNVEAGSQTAAAVINLQRLLPNARVLYVSATGVSDVRNMSYADRLGLWGPSTSYLTFDNFKDALDRRGVAGMELLSLEMKRAGLMAARALSWEGATFETVQLQLTKEQVSAYDGAATWWMKVRASMEDAVKILGEGNVSKTMWRSFWSGIQRFFRDVGVSFKVEAVAKMVLKDVEEGRSAVVGLQSTGETGTSAYLEARLEDLRRERGLRADDKSLQLEDVPIGNGLISTARCGAKAVILNHFPVKEEIPEIPEDPPYPTQNATPLAIAQWHELVRERDSAIARQNPQPVPELVEARDKLLKLADELDLPPNPLDYFIDLVGGYLKVAEMTGRHGRIVRDAKNPKVFRYAKRGGTGVKAKGLMSAPEVDLEFLNVEERRRFQAGEKFIAIISDAASTGISLHAVKDCKSANRRRCHYTVELPWAADKAIQQLGRTHRAGQLSAPMYKLVTTNLGGEVRFASAVSKRMASLGALTRGDRRAASGSDLSDYNVDSKHGNEALTRLYNTLVGGSDAFPCKEAGEIFDTFLHVYPFAPGERPTVAEGGDETEIGRRIVFDYAKEALGEVGLEEGSEARKKPDVKFFLNRIMGLQVAKQNLLFALFEATLRDIVNVAKEGGWYEGCVEDLKATEVVLESMLEIAVDESSGAKTFYANVVLDRGVELEALLDHELGRKEKVGGGRAGDMDCWEGGTVDESAEVVDVDMSDAEKEEDGEGDECVEEEEEEEEEDGEGDDEDDAIDLDDNDDSDMDEAGGEFTGAVTGFYIQTRVTFGKQLVLFAKRKIASSSSSSDENLLNVDPLGLMLITRPNTGKSGFDMTSRELLSKYSLVASIEDLRKEKDPVNVASMTKLKGIWEDTYTRTNTFNYESGLSPRKQRIGVVTGSVMHVFPALESAVKHSAKKDQGLKVVRVEVTKTGRRLIGVRFPYEAFGDLRVILDNLKAARAGLPKGYFIEPFDDVNSQFAKFVGREKKDIKSFFSSAKVPAVGVGGGVGGGGGGAVGSASAALPSSMFTSSSSIANKREASGGAKSVTAAKAGAPALNNAEAKKKAKVDEPVKGQLATFFKPSKSEPEKKADENSSPGSQDSSFSF